MQVSFWSNYHGQTATTSNMIALSLMSALDYRIKLLMTQSHFNKSSLDYYILTKKYLRSELTELSDSGIDALSRFIKFNKVTNEDFANYTISLLKNKLDLLIGTRGTSWEMYINEFASVMDRILSSANKYYDLVYVDTNSGKNDISDGVIKKSDLLVVNLCQNSIVLDDFFERSIKELNNKNVVYMLGNYNPDSRLNIKNIKYRYGFKQEFGVIPYNVEFNDALSEGKVIDFFIKNRQVKKDDPNFYFINETRKSVEILLDKLGIDLNTKKLGD